MGIFVIQTYGAEIESVKGKMEYLNKEKAKNEEYYKATMVNAKKMKKLL